MARNFVTAFLLSLLGIVYVLAVLQWGLLSFSVFGTAASISFFLAVWLVIVVGTRRASLIILAGLAIWYSAIFILGRKDFFAARLLIAPNMIFSFIAIFYFMKRVYALPALQRVFEAVPLSWLMNVQIFRVMGVGFLTLYMTKVLPGEFAIPTGVGDILIGVTGPIVAYIYNLQKSYSKKLAIWWNYLGIADLALALSLGILTYPPLQFLDFQFIPTEISNEPIALFPLVIIPLFAVPLSILLHLFSLRILSKK